MNFLLPELKNELYIHQSIFRERKPSPYAAVKKSLIVGFSGK